MGCLHYVHPGRHDAKYASGLDAPASPHRLGDRRRRRLAWSRGWPSCVRHGEDHADSLPRHAGNSRRLDLLGPPVDEPGLFRFGRGDGVTPLRSNAPRRPRPAGSSARPSVTPSTTPHNPARPQVPPGVSDPAPQRRRDGRGGRPELFGKKSPKSHDLAHYTPIP